MYIGLILLHNYTTQSSLCQGLLRKYAFFRLLRAIFWFLVLWITIFLMFEHQWIFIKSWIIIHFNKISIKSQSYIVLAFGASECQPGKIISSGIFLLDSDIMATLRFSLWNVRPLYLAGEYRIPIIIVKAPFPGAFELREALVLEQLVQRWTADS